MVSDTSAIWKEQSFSGSENEKKTTDTGKAPPIGLEQLISGDVTRKTPLFLIVPQSLTDYDPGLRSRRFWVQIPAGLR